MDWCKFQTVQPCHPCIYQSFAVLRTSFVLVSTRTITIILISFPFFWVFPFANTRDLTLQVSTPQNGHSHSNIMPTNCLSVFYHFVGLALKRLKIIENLVSLIEMNRMKPIRCCRLSSLTTFFLLFIDLIKTLLDHHFLQWICLSWKLEGRYNKCKFVNGKH